MPRRNLRTRLLVGLARTLDEWADGLKDMSAGLRKEARRDVARPTLPQAAPRRASPGARSRVDVESKVNTGEIIVMSAAPEQWLERVGQGGPPAHWLERVRGSGLVVDAGVSEGGVLELEVKPPAGNTEGMNTEAKADVDSSLRREHLLPRTPDRRDAASGDVVRQVGKQMPETATIAPRHRDAHTSERTPVTPDPQDDRGRVFLGRQSSASGVGQPVSVQSRAEASSNGIVDNKIITKPNQDQIRTTEAVGRLPGNAERRESFAERPGAERTEFEGMSRATERSRLPVRERIANRRDERQEASRKVEQHSSYGDVRFPELFASPDASRWPALPDVGWKARGDVEVNDSAWGTEDRQRMDREQRGMQGARKA